MDLTIGFDWGTHQTKICVQDYTDPIQTTYEFLEFETPNGSKTLLFPSVVQINKDHSLSYGFIEENECLYTEPSKEPKPILELLTLPEPFKEPVFKKTKVEPAPKKKLDWKDSLMMLKSGNHSSSQAKEEQKLKEEQDRKLWEIDCKKKKKEYDQKVEEIRKENIKRERDYKIRLEKWEKESKQKPLSFRYFKLHALTGHGKWEIDYISSSEVCVWYVAYLLLVIREKYPDADDTIQFGTPCGANKNPRDTEITDKAYSIFVAAVDLADQFESVDEYLLSTYEELKEKTNLRRIKDEIIDEGYFLDDIPEAYAGLVSVTLQNKIGNGFHLLVDIGGGTTDFALFGVVQKNDDKVPDIFTVESLPHGLNNILEDSQKRESPSSKHNIPLHVIQEDFFINHTDEKYATPITDFQKVMVSYGEKIEKDLKDSFNNSNSYHGRNLSELEKVLENQPVIFAGGGGSYDILHSEIGSFKDLKRIDKEMLAINNLINKDIPDELYPILATSYGLASFQKPIEGLICTKLSHVFLKYLPPQERQEPKHTDYSHGLSDF